MTKRILDRDIDHDGDDDQDESDVEVDRTQPFKPTGTSTPGPSHEHIEMHTLPRKQSGLPDASYDETLLLLGDFIHKDDKPALLQRAKAFIKARFPKANFGKLDPKLQ